ncbi:MAG: general secretion pathway protein GspK [Phycisphaerae bacterium]|nr:general secretion pathway protein GspK [Phycisphaerae bacterium]
MRRSSARSSRLARAVILPTVLMLIALMALMMAGFMFFIRAETAGTVAHLDGQKARLAAESGFEEVTMLLRLPEQCHDSSLWYNVPSRFQHALVWSEMFDRQSDPVREARTRPEALDSEDRVAITWRYSVVAPMFDGLEESFRYGITPESSRLNINTATDEQIEQLISPLLLELGVENSAELVAALLDWMDEDDEVRENGAESEYYAALEPPYQPKNGKLDTIEELLLVKGFNAAVLWGEDTNRNGLLDLNEDDGADSFPYYDNGDGILNYGIAPFLTVWSRETDTTTKNKARINLSAGGSTVAALIGDYIEEGELSDATIAWLESLTASAVENLNSAADLYVGEDEEVLGTIGTSPIMLEEMPIIMDVFSVRPAAEATDVIEGLININTAPSRVLQLIPGMTSEAADAIVAARAADPENMTTTAWPLTNEIIDAATFKAIAPYITTKSYQFHIEIIGYGDHVKLSRRYEWVVEMQGPVAQIRYYRDLTSLGMAWPVDRDLTEYTEQ